jgi:hypothetical protein
VLQASSGQERWWVTIWKATKRHLSSNTSLPDFLVWSAVEQVLTLLAPVQGK